MTDDPANASHAAELVIWMHVENVHDAERSAKEVSTGGVDDTLGLPVDPEV